ncbi:hypothetical protein KRE40_02600 [Elizabethkingia meningoseptica]|uniref:hypothetical protein n=1 Tax=Elizabethkingia TaxID=308865 RepID=UPI0008A9C8AA|nr:MULTISPECIES: hypothetical protein [Elizabethkingia]AQX12342.1 hypothetical protein BBD35_08160 [Elizabethkingia meningoseptica]MBG0513873.1 hypothetical protein [Elizabethkingia meningoseptica]MDE5432789.1 hypothetical protein [Elizabethkingia meningoseptica]MDE5438466.1 hypothetical protein [Elizabethkingia meningoseptica]MDE5449288.1 hypothetical protein [Elizabethkingia meningoseptica]
MKKMNLKHLNLSGADLLSREELKKVLGGNSCGSNWGPTRMVCSLTFLRINSTELAVSFQRSCTNGQCDTSAPPGYVLAGQSGCFAYGISTPCY